jgi:hypothetical protein
VSRRRPVSKRARNVIGIIIAVGVVGYGAIMVGLGLSGFANVHALASRGVPAVGRVSATSGYGKNTIQVTYQVNGRENRCRWSTIPATRRSSAWPAMWVTPVRPGPRQSSARSSWPWSRCPS